MSAGGNRSLLTAVDDMSGMAAERPLQHKLNATEEFFASATKWKRQTERNVKTLHTYRGLEYADLDKRCHQEGIKRQKAVAYKSAQNGSNAWCA
jgi:hypothetical protein